RDDPIGEHVVIAVPEPVRIGRLRTTRGGGWQQDAARDQDREAQDAEEAEASQRSGLLCVATVPEAGRSRKRNPNSRTASPIHATTIALLPRRRKSCPTRIGPATWPMRSRKR